jgi:hypothetical protein
MATPEPSSPAEAVPSAHHPIAVDGVKARLVGLEGWLRAAAACERRYDDTRIADTAADKLVDLQGRLRFQIVPLQVCMAPDGTYDNPADPEAEVDVRQPLAFQRDDAASYFRVTLPHRPVRRVQRLRLMLGTQVVYNVPTDWYSLDPDSGEFHLLPIQGTLQSVAGSWYAAAAISGFAAGRSLPAVCAFDYEAGLPDGWTRHARWRSLRRAAEEHAARGVLEDIAHLYDAGLMRRQISTYGLSQNFDYTRFSDRKQELAASVDAFVDEFKPRNTPFAFEAI